MPCNVFHRNLSEISYYKSTGVKQIYTIQSTLPNERHGCAFTMIYVENSQAFEKFINM